MIKRYAAIYIGSNKCDLIVGQRVKGKVSVLDRAMYPLDFGEQSFEQGEIRFSSVRALCHIIEEYIEIARSSAVEEIEIVASSALREASNRLYLIEQIRSYTGGYGMRLLNKEEEIQLILRYAMLKCDAIFEALTKENTLVIANASGNVSATLVADGAIQCQRSMAMGYLRLRGVFESVENHTEQPERLLSEFMGVNLSELVEDMRDVPVRHLLAVSHDTDAIARLCKMDYDDNYYTIDRERFMSLYHEVGNLTANQIQRRFKSISVEEADSLRYTLILYKNLFDKTGADAMHLVQLSVCDALMGVRFSVVRKQKLKDWIELGTYTSAKTLAQKYRVDTAHADAVEAIALKLFDVLKKRTSMDAQHRFLLRIACQLLDVGRYIGGGAPMNRMIIEHSEIVGLTTRQLALIGAIVDCVRLSPFSESLLDATMPPEDQMTVSMLTAILKLATALDKSHQQKVRKINCRILEREFVITATARENLQLESYYFKSASLAMRKVFGLKPVLKIKREKV